MFTIFGVPVSGPVVTLYSVMMVFEVFWALLLKPSNGFALNWATAGVIGSMLIWNAMYALLLKHGVPMIYLSASVSVSTPLVGVLVGVFHLEERVPPGEAIGLLIGFLGIGYAVYSRVTAAPIAT